MWTWTVAILLVSVSCQAVHSMLNTNSDTLRRVVQADLNLQPRLSACWTAQLLSDFQRLRGRELYVRAVQTGCAIPMQYFTANLKHRMRGVWRDAELVDPNTHNNKLATYHSWFAIPFSRNEHMPINVPQFLHLDLFKHVMRNISRFRLRAHTLKVEAAAWLEDVWFSHMWAILMSWCRWTCSERGACSFNLPRPCHIKLPSLQSIRLSTNTNYGCAFGPRKASKVEKPSSRGVSSLHRWSLMLLPVLWLMPLRSLHTCMCVY